MLLSTHSHHSGGSKIFHLDSFWLEYHGCHNNVLKAWNINSSSSYPMQAFSHSNYRTKSNLIRWRTKGMSYFEVEIMNIEVEISNLKKKMRTPLTLGFRFCSEHSIIGTMLSNNKIPFTGPRDLRCKG